MGSIILCDFDQGFREPEMVKRRTVIVLTPRIGARPKLCTVVALSNTAPVPVMPYHAQLDIDPPLPSGLASKGLWIKGDMIYAVGFHRLDLIRTGKDFGAKREYYMHQLSAEQLKLVRSCVLKGLNLAALTKHL